MTVMRNNNENGKTEFFEINLYDVDFIEKESKYIVYYIDGEKYYQITTKSELEELLTDIGFDSLDRSNLVNMTKVKHYDKEFGKVFFEDSPSRDSKYATVARVKEKAIEKFIQFIINEGNDLENELHLPQTQRFNRWFHSLMKGQLK